MNREERLTEESQFTTGAKVISAIFLVGVVALLATPAPLHAGMIAMPVALHALEHADREMGTPSSARSTPASDATANVAKQDRCGTHVLKLRDPAVCSIAILRCGVPAVI